MIPDLEDLQARNDSIRELVDALDLHRSGEGAHADRVSVYAVATGHEMGIGPEGLLDLRRAAVLHDVGKIAVSKELLGRLGQLSEEELDEIRLHAVLAMKVVESIEWLGPATLMIRYHHERWDGLGYPEGLSGDEIPLGARIIAVAEAFDCMVHGEGWKPRVSEYAGLEELGRCSGTQFDPNVVFAFKKVQPLIQPLD